MSKSILQTERYCYFCGAIRGLHEHHVYSGGNRQASENNGFKVYLCGRHHNLSEFGVHSASDQDLWLKRKCQRVYERTHTREEFIALIGKNYLETKNE